jgi:hypothetical protein
MPLWSNTDANTSVPKFAPMYVQLHTTQANSNLMYGNTTTSAFITGANVGVFGVDTVEMANTNATSIASRPAHAGWVLRKAGTGGRANRVSTEVLVAMGSMTGDGSVSANDNLIYANT